MSLQKTTISFSPGQADDTPAYIDLRGKTRQNAIGQEHLAELGITAQSWGEMIASGNLPGQVCHQDGKLIGYCFGNRDSGEIVVLALLPQAEGCGIGKALLDTVMAELRAAGHARLFLGCCSDPQSRSYGFYRHLGWTATGETDQYGDEVLEYRYNSRG